MTHTRQTYKKIAHYEQLGYTIIEGNNPLLDKAKKWKPFHCVRLAQTNSRRHGKCINTVWAVKRLT